MAFWDHMRWSYYHTSYGLGSLGYDNDPLSLTLLPRVVLLEGLVQAIAQAQLVGGLCRYSAKATHVFLPADSMLPWLHRSMVGVMVMSNFMLVAHYLIFARIYRAVRTASQEVWTSVGYFCCILAIYLLALFCRIGIWWYQGLLKLLRHGTSGW